MLTKIKGFIFQEIQSGVQKILMLALYYATLFMFFFNPLNEEGIRVTSFSRIFGMGTIENHDINKIILNFSVWLLGFVIVTYLFYLIFSKLFSIRSGFSKGEVIKHIEFLLPLAYAGLLFEVIGYFADAAGGLDIIFDLGLLLMTSVLTFDCLYIACSLENYMSYRVYQIFFFSILGLSLPVSIALFTKWNQGIYWMLTFWVLWVLGILLIVGIEKIQKSRVFVNGLCEAGMLFLGILPMTSLYIEAVNVMNQYGIFIHNPKKWYLIGSFLYFMISLLLGFILIRLNKKFFEEEKYKSWVYPVILLGFTLFAVQLPLSMTVEVDLMESANYSISISDFFSYGKIPVIEHFPGHMLSGVLGGILYGVINSDLAGAAAAPYSVYIYLVLVLGFYFFLQFLTNREFAFWCSMILPIFGGFKNFLNPDSAYGLWGFFGVGIIICLAMHRYIKKKTFLNSAWVWLACAAVTLYRFDLGVAFGIAAVLTGVFFTLFFHEGKNIDKLLLPFFLVILSGVGILVVICEVCGISSIGLLKEFVHIAASNVNWAYGNIGDMRGTMFAWCYFILPVVSGILLVALLFSKQIREKFGSYEFCTCVFLGFAYFANFSRGLVRHSIAENNVTVVTFCGVFFLLVYLLCITRKKQYFLYSLMGVIVFYGTFGSADGFPDRSLAENAGTQMCEFFDGWNGQDGKPSGWETHNGRAQRVNYTEELNATAVKLDTVLSLLLEENETYLDFENKTYFYSVLNRPCPVYVSQSPALVSGEVSQEEFIREIEESENPIKAVLMPNEKSEGFALKMDGILNSYRYYKISEYIYQNFVPVCEFEDISVWCKKEDYESEKKKIEENLPALLDLSKDFSLAEAGYDSYNINHCSDLKNLPYIWGTYDEKRAFENEVIKEVEKTEQKWNEKSIYEFERIQDAEKLQGNYLLLQCTYEPEEEDTEKRCTLSFGTDSQKFNPLFRFDFILQPGTEQYLFRISTDYYWYFEQIHALTFSAENEMKDMEIKILSGD